jgi:hypothetical protein
MHRNTDTQQVQRSTLMPTYPQSISFILMRNLWIYGAVSDQNLPSRARGGLIWAHRAPAHSLMCSPAVTAAENGVDAFLAGFYDFLTITQAQPAGRPPGHFSASAICSSITWATARGLSPLIWAMICVPTWSHFSEGETGLRASPKDPRTQTSKISDAVRVGALVRWATGATILATEPAA